MVPTDNIRSRQRGFSLIEVAILMVVAGLLSVSILQGQRVIDNARVRAVMRQQDHVEAAFLAFQDRYRALPGDYRSAVDNIPQVTASGNGNGLVEHETGTLVGATGTPFEAVLVWHHLSQSGMLNGEYPFNPNNISRSVPTNLWGGYINIAYDNYYGDPSAAPISRHTLKTGNNVPVRVLFEIDQKIDDGQALTGRFQFSNFVWAGAAPPAPGLAGECASTAGVWKAVIDNPPTNCGGASVL
ncbi:MAG: type II secretion system protein [Burkholderiales bacterium]|nr:type II secretion system protein [Burkholderiales bacterium]